MLEEFRSIRPAFQRCRPCKMVSGNRSQSLSLMKVDIMMGPFQWLSLLDIIESLSTVKVEEETV